MSTELGALLGRAAEELSTDGPLDDLRAVGLRRVVRRRRVQRHTVESVAGVAAAGVVGTAAWFGLDRGVPAPPAHTPSPSVSATPTLTPTPTPTPTPNPSLPPPLTPAPARAGVPDAFVAPPGLLGQTAEGWMLSIYRPQYVPVGGTVDDARADVQEVHLVSPAGEHYALLSLPVDPQVTVLHWDATAERARVGMTSDGHDMTVGWLDLRTGALTTDQPPFDETGTYLTTLPDGNELWTELEKTLLEGAANPGVGVYVVAPGADPRLLVVDPYPLNHAYLDPGSEQIVTETVGWGGLDVTRISDGSTRHISYDRPGVQCFLVGWVDDTSVLVTCNDADGRAIVDGGLPTTVLVDTATSTATVVSRLELGDPFPGISGRGVSAGGTLVFQGAPLTEDATFVDPTTGLYAWAGGTSTLLQSLGDDGGMFWTSVRGSTVYAEVAPTNADRAETITAHDLESGATTVLSGAPAPAEGVGQWLGDSVSWWVAGSSGN
ncbi:hypothetical protein ASD16_08880 [Cellulomonas sp. Root485]|uniref:hypothetical protein n=1 Tax=Cellulomonas sp. Root485 TaxID=1736546 RepID=UPI0006FFAC56|nr:hypothetical protein [Cellulomonas sp. Root485]KQY22734.1 hypothetical protein ASD16_08880 [Cellulomonas sp. Root485]